MRVPIISIFALLLISAIAQAQVYYIVPSTQAQTLVSNVTFPQAATYQITEISPRFSSQNTGGILLVTIQNVGLKPGTMVRAAIKSKTPGITFTGILDQLGFIDWMDTRTASFPYRIDSVVDGDYPMYFTVYDGTSITDFQFNFTMSRVPLRFGVVCGDSICDSSENSIACPHDCASGVPVNVTNETVTGPYALPGSTCDIFRVDSTSLRDKEDGRINPTDKFNLGIYLHSTTTTTIYDTKAYLQHDNPNIITPDTDTGYITFGDRATIPAYFPMETKDVTPGQYGMVMRTTYVKDARECLQLIPVNITVEGGYAFSLNLMPDSLETQPQSQITLKAHIRNTGSRDDTYDLTFRGVSEWVQQADRTVIVKAGQDKDAYIKLYVPPVTGLYQFTAEAKSRTLSQVSDRDTTLISVSQPIKPIHAINLLVTDSRSIDIVRGEGGQFRIKVQNAGTVKDTISITATGAPWAYLKPDLLTLQPGEIAELSLYAAPTADAETGTHTITLKASSTGGEAATEEAVSVYVADKKASLPQAAEGGPKNNATIVGGLVLLAKGASAYGGTPIVFGILVLAGLLLALSGKKEKAEGLVPLKGN